MVSPRRDRPAPGDPPPDGVEVVHRVIIAVEEAVSVLRSVDSSHETRLPALREVDLAHRIWFNRDALTGSAMEASRRPDEYRRAADLGDALVEALRAVQRIVEAPASSARLRRERLRPVHRIDRAIDDARAPLTARRCLVECVHAAATDLDALYTLTGRAPPWARERRAPLNKGDLDAVTFVTKRFSVVFPEYQLHLEGAATPIDKAVTSWRAATTRRGADTERWDAVQELVLATALAGRDVPSPPVLRQDFSGERRGIDARSTFFRAVASEAIRIDLAPRGAAVTTPALAFELVIHSPLATYAFDPAFPHALLNARRRRLLRR